MSLFIAVAQIRAHAAVRRSVDLDAAETRSSEHGAGVVEYLGLAALGISIVGALLLGMGPVVDTLLGNLMDMVS